MVRCLAVNSYLASGDSSWFGEVRAAHEKPRAKWEQDLSHSPFRRPGPTVGRWLWPVARQAVMTAASEFGEGMRGARLAAPTASFAFMLNARHYSTRITGKNVVI